MMKTNLKVVDESPLFVQHHNQEWSVELTLLKELDGESCNEKFPCGLYDLKDSKTFGEKSVDLEIQRVEIIGENHLTLFAWLMDGENCGKIALEVLE